MRRSGTILGVGAALLASGGLSACGPDTGEDGPAAAATYDTADADLLDPFVADPDWTVEETIAHVEAGMALGFPDPRIPVEAYVELLEGRDETCPNAGEHLIGQDMPIDGCTSASGYHYAGNTTLLRFSSKDPSREMEGYSLGGDFEIRDPEGYILAGGGAMTYTWSREANGQTVWMGEAAGSWVHDKRDDAFGLGVSGTLTFRGAAATADDNVALTGTVGVGEMYIQFVDVSWAASCGGYPSGSVRMRDPSGVWSTLDYGDRCDGCGTYTIDLLGETSEACLDLGVYKATIEDLGTW
jgi:hypothetical protein